MSGHPSKPIPLSRAYPAPAVFGGEAATQDRKINELIIREPLVDDLIKSRRIAGNIDVEQDKALAAICSGEHPDVIGKLALCDWLLVDAALAGFALPPESEETPAASSSDA